MGFGCKNEQYISHRSTKESLRMISWSDCWRLPWRCSGYRFSCDMLIPIIIQPVLVLLVALFSYDSILIVSAAFAVILLVVSVFVNQGSRHQFYYYWTASSITYIVIIFENIVVPLSEIETQENFVLILFIVFAIFFLYLTKTVPEQSNCRGDSFNNGVLNETCPLCRIKIRPRSYHCRICQMCVAKYDYHCYWLNSCIGECNQQFFIVGVIFSMLALGYASLLILTTICDPEFVLGILLPKDCADVSATLGMSVCFVSGVYSMELALLLLIQLLHQVWLISRGYSALEWREQFKYSILRPSPYSKGFFGNWISCLKSFRKLN